MSIEQDFSDRQSQYMFFRQPWHVKGWVPALLSSIRNAQSDSVSF